MFGQTFAPGDLATVGFLVVLEGLLSIDNALVLGVLAQRVEPPLRMRALSYGLIGGLLLRLAAIAAAAILLRFSILKLLGGIYLLWISLDYFVRKKANVPSNDSPSLSDGGFWRTLASIELTDLAFAADSILAAVALVGAAPPGSKAMFHPKFWVIAVGGMLGIVMMRFAAAAIAKMLGRFPRLHRSAYLLVLLIGTKLLIDFAANNPSHPHRVDFQDPGRIELWLFWLCAVIALAAGLTGRRAR
jgi:YkoY family integral membrane protein